MFAGGHWFAYAQQDGPGDVRVCHRSGVPHMPSKDEVARKLAEAHYVIEPGITQIFRIQAGAEAETRPDEPIKLLEVNENTIPTGIMPLTFASAPAQGFPFSSIIV